MSLTDELTQKPAPKFQIDDINKDFQEAFSFMETIISENKEGIFNMNSKINKDSAENLFNYLNRNHQNYDFELNNAKTKLSNNV